MTTLVVCSIIIIWILLILSALFNESVETSETKGSFKEVKKELKIEKIEVPKKESISNESLTKYLGTLYKYNDVYLSVSSNRNIFSVGLYSASQNELFAAAMSSYSRSVLEQNWIYCPIRKEMTKLTRPITLGIIWFDVKDSGFLEISYTPLYLEYNKSEDTLFADTEHEILELVKLKEFLIKAQQVSEEERQLLIEKRKDFIRVEKDIYAKNFVDRIFKLHYEYNSTQLAINRAASLTSVDTFINFCKLINKSIPSDYSPEIINYLYLLFGDKVNET